MTSAPYSALLEKLKIIADKAVNTGAPAYRPGREIDEQLWQREVGNSIPELAMAYCMTGDKKYLNSARDFMLASASYPTWGTGNIDNRDLATGHQMYGMALGYDWLYSDLDVASRDSIRNCLVKRGARLYDLLLTKQVWWHSSYLHNHQHVPLAGLATAGFALYGDNVNVDGWILLSLKKFREVMTAMPPDGGSIEGIPYSGYSAEYLLKFMSLSKDLLGEDLFKGNPYIKNFASFRLYAMIPKDYWESSGSRLMTAGDSPRTDWYGPDYLLRKLASEYKDGHAQWLANEMDSAGYSNPQAFFLNLLWINPDVKPMQPKALPPTKYFNDLDVAYMRSGWDGKESQSMFKCGSWIGHSAFAKNYSYSGHTHPDAGSFLIFSHGDWLVADDGYAFKRTTYQNTLVINGKGQIGEGTWFDDKPFRGGHEQPSIVYTASNKEYDYFIGNAKPAYPSSTHLTFFYRHLLYLKPDCWVVADEVKADSTSLFEFYYHSDFPFVSAGENAFKAEGTRGSMMVTMMKPDNTAKQAFLQDIQGTGGRFQRKMNTLKISSADKTSDFFITVFETYPSGESPTLNPAIVSSKKGEFLVLKTKNGTKRFRIVSERSEKKSPLFIEEKQ